MDVGHVERREHSDLPDAPPELPRLEALHGPGRDRRRRRCVASSRPRDAERAAGEVLRLADQTVVVGSADDRREPARAPASRSSSRGSRVERQAHDDAADAGMGSPMTYAGGRVGCRRLATVLDDAAWNVLPLGSPPAPAMLVDRSGGCSHPTCARTWPVLVDEQDVDARVHVDEHLGEMRARCPASCARDRVAWSLRRPRARATRA